MKSFLIKLIGYTTSFWICCPKCGARTYDTGGVSEWERCTKCDWEE